MGFFSNFLKRNVKEKSDEIKSIILLNEEISNLLLENKYISKKEYNYIFINYKKHIDFFQMLINEKLLVNYCNKNNISIEKIKKTIYKYDNLEDLISKHNKKYIDSKLVEEKEYLDSILTKVDPNISLDQEQRRVVLSDEDYTLVIAGAGAGKTTTMAAKVKYLVEKKNINPKEILVISFTNKAVNELKDKINKDLKLDVPISTFHSVGNAILHKSEDQLKKVVDPSRLYFVLQDYFKTNIVKNPSLMKNLTLFFSTYFDFDDDSKNIEEYINSLAKSNYTTMKSDLNQYAYDIIDKRTNKKKTILLELVKSKEEVFIANYLFMHNIEYKYEPVYKYNILYASKPYTPDFVIKQGNKYAYIEHFGISESGHNDKYSDMELTRYKKAINDKISIHKKHHTDLICTYSSYNDGRGLKEHLVEELLKRGFVLSEKSEEEIVKKIISDEQNRYLMRLLALVTRFIHMYKVNGYDSSQFDRMYASTKNERTKLFLKIAKECYFEYQRYLTSNNSIDFDDMINNSTRILNEVKEIGDKLSFKYIIVDEYQDISMQRFDLIKSLHDVSDAKIIAVGDDFQSIYAFSGSDITLFTEFKEKFGYADVIRITNTYRNSQELIDIAGNFIEKNKMQIYKELKSPKHLENPIVINTYQQTFNKNEKVMLNIADATELALDDIVKNQGVESNVLLLGRFGFDGYLLSKSNKFEFKNYGSKVVSKKYPKLKITYMTAHSSKGLGYDNVIVINCKNATYGFPAKIDDDPVLSLVIKDDKSYQYAEERRLFYVALTRTKNKVYLISPSKFPSEFLIEILSEYKGIKVNGEIDLSITKKHHSYKECPICGYPMQYKYKEAYGLPLYICMNNPEICGFMTNIYGAGKLEIVKCDKCQDGYLIVKKASEKGNYFLGCTNYKKDKTGCNRTISRELFYKKYGRIYVIEDENK